jgi:DNA-binding transcriptional MocR family regulator
MKAEEKEPWIPRLSPAGGSWAQRLADAIAADVESGRLAPGERLPTQRAMASQLGITPGTVNRGYALAERAGLISAEVGRGTFVLAPGDTGIHDASLAREAAGAIELGLNYPAGTDAEAELDRALSRLVGRQGGAPLLALAPYAGRPEHRAAGALWLRRVGLSVDGGDVLLTTGVQHGLAAALAALTGPGDAVLTESLTGPSIKGLAAMHYLRLVGVECDEDGLLPDALASAARSAGARVVYSMPTLHTPTTATMPEYRRRAIAAVLAAHDLVAIEDDAWGFLAAGGATPLRALAPDRVVYLTSFSKNLAPGLRVGYAVPPPALQRAVTSAIGAMTWTPPLLAEVASGWITDGTAAALTDARVETAAARQHMAEEIVGPDLVRPAFPAFHLWLPLPEPWRVDEFVAQAAAHGVSLASPDIFVPSRAATPHALRLCTGTEADARRVEQGLRVVTRMLRSGPMAYSVPRV